MCDTEVYTIKVDTVNTNISNVSFTAFLNIPLRNVIKAELLSASVFTSGMTTGVLHVYVEELGSKFNDRADLLYTIGTRGGTSTQGGQTAPLANVANLSRAIACIPLDQTNPRTVFAIGNAFPTDVVFIDPIRQIKSLNISIYDEYGILASDLNYPTFLTFRFTCAKPNVCLYPDRGVGAFP
jgi:hypothetical protein